MSLINDMLHDLEKRRVQENREIPAYEVPIINRVASAGRRIALWLGAIILAAGLTWAAIFFIPVFLPQPAKAPSVVEPEAAKIKPAPVVDDEPVLVRHEEPSSKAEQIREPLAVEPVPVTVEQEQVDEPLNMLLPGAEIREDDNTAKLTLAFSQLPRYQLMQSGDQDKPLILEFDQTQPARNFTVTASSGVIIKKVEVLPQGEGMELLVNLAEHTQLEGLAIGEKVEPGGKKIFLLAADFLQKKPSQEVVRIHAEYPLKIVADLTETAKNSQQLAEEGEADPEILEEKPSSLTKTDNLLSTDRQAYADGMKMLGQGNLPAAAANFGEALRENPSFVEARLQLIDVLLRQGRQELALEEVRLGLSRVPGNGMLRKKYARFLFDGKRYGEAIGLLQKPPVPEISKDPEYHALLAALLREAGQFRAASEVYARLLQLRPDESLWWLGLAVSMDQIGESDQARKAYRQAMALPGLAPQLQSYIQSRLEVL